MFDGIRDVVVDAGAIASALAAIAGVVYAIVRWGVLRPLDKRIREATKQIQPGANGGESLADVAKGLTALSEEVASIRDRFENVEQRQMVILEMVLREQHALLNLQHDSDGGQV